MQQHITPKSASKLEKLLILAFSLAALYYYFSKILHLNETSLFWQICDDAYISLVYAKNLFNGLGLIYNEGEQVEGYTNFVWTLIMSVPFFIKQDPIIFIKVCGAISGIVLAMATYSTLYRSCGRLTAILTAALLISSESIIYMTQWGLETIFFAACLTSCLALMLGDKPQIKLSAVVYAITCMTRIEAIIFLPVLTLFLLFRSRKQCLTFIVLSMSIFSVYFLWRYQYYGYLMPNTFYAKVGGGGFKLVARGADYWVEQAKALGIFYPIILSVIAFPAMLFKRPADRSLLLSTALFFFLSITATAYICYVGGDVFNERFIIHYLSFYLIFSACIVRWILDLVSRQLGRKSYSEALTALIMAFLYLGIFTTPVRYPYSTHLTGWISLAQRLNADLRPHELFASDAAGALRYYAERNMIDILGLTDSTIAHKKVELGKGVAGHEKLDDQYVLSRSPVFITSWIDEDGLLGREFKKHFDFRANYELAYLLDTSQKEISDQRILNAANVVDYCNLLEKVSRINKTNGIYDWAAYKKRDSFIPVRLQYNDFSLGKDVVISADCSHPHRLKFSRKAPSDSYLVFGPYFRLAKGKYKITVAIEKLNGKELLFDIARNGKALWGTRITQELMGSNDYIFSHELTIEEAGEANWEFRFNLPSVENEAIIKYVEIENLARNLN